MCTFAQLQGQTLFFKIVAQAEQTFFLSLSAPRRAPPPTMDDQAADWASEQPETKEKRRTEKSTEHLIPTKMTF